MHCISAIMVTWWAVKTSLQHLKKLLVVWVVCLWRLSSFLWFCFVLFLLQSSSNFHVIPSSVRCEQYCTIGQSCLCGTAGSCAGHAKTVMSAFVFLVGGTLFFRGILSDVSPTAVRPPPPRRPTPGRSASPQVLLPKAVPVAPAAATKPASNTFHLGALQRKPSPALSSTVASATDSVSNEAPVGTSHLVASGSHRRFGMSCSPPVYFTWVASKAFWNKYLWTSNKSEVTMASTHVSTNSHWHSQHSVQFCSYCLSLQRPRELWLLFFSWKE